MATRTAIAIERSMRCEGVLLRFSLKGRTPNSPAMRRGGTVLTPAHIMQISQRPVHPTMQPDQTSSSKRSYCSHCPTDTPKFPTILKSPFEATAHPSLLPFFNQSIINLQRRQLINIVQPIPTPLLLLQPAPEKEKSALKFSTKILGQPITTKTYHS